MLYYSSRNFISNITPTHTRIVVDIILTTDKLGRTIFVVSGGISNRSYKRGKMMIDTSIDTRLIPAIPSKIYPTNFFPILQHQLF